MMGVWRGAQQAMNMPVLAKRRVPWGTLLALPTGASTPTIIYTELSEYTEITYFCVG